MAILSTEIVQKALAHLALKMGLPLNLDADELDSYWEDLRGYSIEDLRDGIKWIIKPLDKKVFITNRTRVPSVMDIHEGVRLSLEWYEKDRKAKARELFHAIDNKQRLAEWYEKNGMKHFTIQDLKTCYKADHTRDGLIAKVESLLKGKTMDDLGLRAMLSDPSKSNEPATEEEKRYWQKRFWDDFGMNIFPNGVMESPVFCPE